MSAGDACIALQAGMDVKIGSGQTYAGLNGRVQYADHKDVAICKLAEYNPEYWGCKTYCQWNSGNGELHANYGVSVLSLVKQGSHQILHTPTKCQS